MKLFTRAAAPSVALALSILVAGCSKEPPAGADANAPIKVQKRKIATKMQKEEAEKLLAESMSRTVQAAQLASLGLSAKQGIKVKGPVGAAQVPAKSKADEAKAAAAKTEVAAPAATAAPAAAAPAAAGAPAAGAPAAAPAAGAEAVAPPAVPALLGSEALANQLLEQAFLVLVIFWAELVHFVPELRQH